jgi:hypothetical protein
MNKDFNKLLNDHYSLRTKYADLLNKIKESSIFGSWKPIAEYDKSSLPEHMEVMFYHPAYTTKEGKKMGPGHQCLKWPGVPYTHFLVVPNICLPNTLVQPRASS